MAAAAVVVLACSVALRLLAPRLARRSDPCTATFALTALGIAAAGACWFVLATLAFTTLGTVPSVAAVGRWSPTLVAAYGNVPDAVGLAAGATLAVLALHAARHASRSGLERWRVDALCRSMDGGPAGVVMVDDAGATACALGGRSGRIVVSRPLMIALPDVEGACVLAHERAHLVHHHDLHRRLVGLAAAANPLLGPLVPAVRFATERWADEAASGPDRSTTARAIARVALLTAAPATAGLRLGADDVEGRVDALLRPRRPAHAPLAVAAVLLLGLALGSAVARHATEGTFERAELDDAPAAAR